MYELLEVTAGIKRIVMANPLHVRLISAAQIKTDKVDSRKLALLSTVPGLGPILGNVIATEIDSIERFGDSASLCAYAGLIPCTSSSGDKTYHERLVPGCNKWLRWVLVEAAWVAVGCSAYFGGFYRHHRTRGKKVNTAIMIVARALIL